MTTSSTPIAQSEFYALTPFSENTTQYVMDGNISDPPPTLVVPSDEDRELWKNLAPGSSRARGKDSRACRARWDEPFAGWLAGGHYRSLSTPLEPSAELLTLVLDEEPAVDIQGGGEGSPCTRERWSAEGPYPNQPAAALQGGIVGGTASSGTGYRHPLLDGPLDLSAQGSRERYRRRPGRPRGPFPRMTLNHPAAAAHLHPDR